MNNQHDVLDMQFVYCRFISSRKIIDNFKMEICVQWTNKEIEKAVKFFNTKYENDYLKMEQIQFVILGKLLEDNVTVQDHLKQNGVKEKIVDTINYDECDELEIFMNFSPINSIQCQQKQKDINTQRLHLMVETITQIELGDLISKKKFNNEFYELYKNINFDLLHRKDHGYYFLIQNYISKINLPSVKQKEFKSKKTKLQIQIMNREQYFQDIRTHQEKHNVQKEEQFQAKKKVVSIIEFMYKNHLLLPFIFLQIFMVVYFYNFIFIAAIIISIANYNTDFFVDHANNTEIKKQFFQDKSTKKKIFLVIIETSINFFLSIGFCFDYTKTKGKFQKFLKNFEQEKIQEEASQQTQQNQTENLSDESDNSDDNQQQSQQSISEGFIEEKNEENLILNDVDLQQEIYKNQENNVLHDNTQISDKEEFQNMNIENLKTYTMNDQQIENYLFDLAEEKQQNIQLKKTKINLKNQQNKYN